jgi:hypothetical protein
MERLIRKELDGGIDDPLAFFVVAKSHVSCQSERFLPRICKTDWSVLSRSVRHRRSSESSDAYDRADIGNVIYWLML